MRIRAIYKALYHGILPYWRYEKIKHYDCSYIQHLFINLKYAWRWIVFKEDESDIEFEKRTNGFAEEAEQKIFKNETNDE